MADAGGGDHDEDDRQESVVGLASTEAGHDEQGDHKKQSDRAQRGDNQIIDLFTVLGRRQSSIRQPVETGNGEAKAK